MRFRWWAVTMLCASATARAQVSPATGPATSQKFQVQQSVTVTADRGLAGINDSASSVAVLPAEKLEAAPGLTLDDRLHSVAGFQLFRRTSSWTANPTTQGVSLRGLGSTAASRTLVVSDQVPLNDPFGGWIHWDEIPPLALQQVQLLRGGSADLYGSSAIGGVVDIVPAEPEPAKLRFAADASGATQDSGLGDALLSADTRNFATLVAGSALTTAGYIPTAPQFRGTVDVPSNVTEQSGRLELRTPSRFSAESAFLRGNVLNEARANGTPLQTNATRLWRYVGGADLERDTSHVALRLFGAREGYRQSFSSIAADRNSERLTRLQRVPTDELGFSLQGTHAFAAKITGALGLDARDVRATDAESSVAVNGNVSSTTSISARQREVGGFADAIWQPHGWSLSGSVRVDSFRTFDAQQLVSTTLTRTPLPEIDELVASPRVGLVRYLPHNFALTGTAFRAFRGPTMNELYRTGQVGQQTTLANNALLAERATGFEFGGEWQARRFGQVRATYFWTEVNRPISAVVLTQSATAQTLQRQNLGQIRSRGVMIETQSHTWRGLDATIGYQLAVATVTAFNTSSPAQQNLTGKWIPQVPRQAVTATANYALARVANLHVIASYTGQQFDDASNQFLLHPFARFDVSADRTLWRGLSVFASAQNLLDRSIDAGRTPVLTLASPRLVQAGLRWNVGR